jgi:hypothetical protein
MQLIARTSSILLNPRSAWAEIAANDDAPRQVLLGHVAPLALLSALAGFVGYSLIGTGAFGVTVRVPVLAGLVQVALGVVFALLMVGVLAWLAQWLAPRFGGEASLTQAVKLAGYSATAGLLGGLFQIIPWLAVLGLLAALYSLYLLYTGLPVLMKNRPEDTLKYALVLIGAAVVCGFVIGMVGQLFTPGATSAVGRLGAGGSDAPVIAIETPDGRVGINVNTAALEALGKKLEAGARKMEQAAAAGKEQAGTGKAARGGATSQTGSEAGQPGVQASAQALQQGAEAAAGALAGMLGAVAGGNDPKAGQPPASAEQMVAVLPEALAGLPRESLQQRSEGGLNMSMVNARFRADKRQLALMLTHQRFLAAAIGLQPEERSEDAKRVTHKRRDAASGWYIDEDYQRDGSRAKLGVILPNGVRLQLDGRGMDRDAVEAALRSLPLEQMAAW